MIGYGNFKLLEKNKTVVDFNENENEILIQCDEVELARIKLSILNRKDIHSISVGVSSAMNLIKSRGNWCVMCGEDIGVSNPRQLCRRTYCENEDQIETSRNDSVESFLPMTKKMKKNES